MYQMLVKMKPQRKTDKNFDREAAGWIKVTNSVTFELQVGGKNQRGYAHKFTQNVGCIQGQEQTLDCLWLSPGKFAWSIKQESMKQFSTEGFITSSTLTWREPPCWEQVYLFLSKTSGVIAMTILSSKSCSEWQKRKNILGNVRFSLTHSNQTYGHRMTSNSGSLSSRLVGLSKLFCGWKRVWGHQLQWTKTMS